MLKHDFVLALALAATPVGAHAQAQMTPTAEQSCEGADAAMKREWAATSKFITKRDSAHRTCGGGFGYSAALLAGQRASLNDRRVQGVIVGGKFAGDTMQAMARLGCLADLSGERAVQLAALRSSG